MSKHIFITGYYGFGNTGDEAILAAIVADLRALRPEVRITVSSGNPDETAAQYGVEAIPCTAAAEMADVTRAADLVVIGGGGIFHDYWGVDPNAFLSNKQWGISYFAAPAALAALYGKPLMLYAIGAGPLLSEYGRKFTRLACEIASVITVRDEHSKQVLEAIGVAPGKVRVTADPAWSLSLSDVDLGELIPQPGSSPGPLVGVAVRHWDVGVHPAFWEREVAAGLDLFLKEHGGTIVFIPFQSLSGAQENDDAVIGRIRSAMKRLETVTMVEHQSLSPQERFALLGQCDLILAMRLHANIAAVLQDKPVVALSYDSKVEQFMLRTGLEPWMIDVRSVDAHTLAGRLGDALQRPAGSGESGARVRHELTALARENARLAVELLDPGAERADVPVFIHRDLAEALARTLVAHLREAGSLTTENKKFYDEFMYYLDASHNFQKQVEELSAGAKRHAGQLAQRDADLAASRATIEELRAQTAGFTRQMEYAEGNRLKVLDSLERYQKAFDQELTLYRNQRAWQVMLVIRKAYSLLMRRGAGAFLGWLLRLPAGGGMGLAEHDLHFPSVWKFISEEMHVPFWDRTSAGETEPQVADGRVPAHLGRYDVVILPVFDFEFRFQRPQQIAAQYARQGHRVFWVSPVRGVPPSSAQRYEATLLRENLYEIRVRSEPQHLYDGELTHEKARLLHDCLADVFRDFAVSESCAILQFPYWRRLGIALRETFGTKVLYDCMDDWEEWKTEPLINAFNLSEERLLATESDVLIVTARALAEKFVQRGGHPTLVPNGADFPFFRSPRPNPLLAHVPGPIVGYYGAIANWLDLDLMYEVARIRPQYSFVMVGCVYSEKAERMRDLPNVMFTGEKTYREMPLYLSWFDACVIPFFLDELTKAVDPVKMYEYFSQGKPVVATDMTELAVAADLLYFGNGPEDFAQKLDLAVAEPPDSPLRLKRIEFAAANTWEARVRTLDEAVKPAFPLVSILVVTYNSSEFLDPFFDAVRRNTSYPSYEVLVIDNNSTDGTRERLQEIAAGDPHIRVTCLDRNAGFAAANNVAARQAGGEYLIFLNPDTVVTPGWIGRLVEHCRKDSTAGLVCAVTNFAGNEVKIDFDYRNVGEMEQFALRRAREKMGVTLDVPMVPLFCVLTPRAVWNKVGELDEGFQIGMFEDDDFSMRVRKAGYRVLAAEDCFVHHFGNGSFDKLASEEYQRVFEQNRQRYEAKWRTPWQAHELRPGVRNPIDEQRFTPGTFVKVDGSSFKDEVPRLVLRGLHPAGTRAGQGFQVQSNGLAALAAECENARPASLVMFDNIPLATNYGGPNLLTAWVPEEMYAKPGRYTVYLVNDFGESNRMEFVVED